MDFTGTHLLIDLFGCVGLDDIDRVEATLRNMVAAAGANLLELRLHSFGVGQGVTGVAMLAESHISIHTWPERDYAAADIFLCGRSHDLDAALDTLASGLGATRYEQQRLARGYGVERALTGARL
ncbi:S-adenosylmethionine decarboxylase [Sphingomonas sp. UYAg733]